jgi:hypothetical protein
MAEEVGGRVVSCELRVARRVAGDRQEPGEVGPIYIYGALEPLNP